MSDREQGLMIEVGDGRLVISIGVDALMTAVKAGNDWDQDAVIVDPDAFAVSIARGLASKEYEDGSTDLHHAIDKAAMDAVESGDEAVRWSGDD